ncbi:hypothetical protein CR513_54008, partial [Mucuna pruriens]
MALVSPLVVVYLVDASALTFMGPQEGETYFIYLYETYILDLGVTIPFDSFEIDVLNVLNVTPTQLHPNSWAVMQVFKVVCRCLHMEPTTAKFLHHYVVHHYVVHQYQKSGWISLIGIHKIYILNSYSSSCKDFKDGFF